MPAGRHTARFRGDPVPARPVAPQLAGLLERLLGAPLPIRIRAWDGSEAGPTPDPDGPPPPVVLVRHRRALRRLLWNPGELGLARAFVAGELDVEGDIADGLSRFWKLARSGNRRTAGRRARRAHRRHAARRAAQHARQGGRRPARAAPWRCRSAPGRTGVRGPAVRRVAHPPPGPGRDRPSLRPVERLLRVPARSAAGLLLRVLDPGGRRRTTASSTPSATSWT